MYATIGLAPTEPTAEGGPMARTKKRSGFPARVAFRTQTGSRYQVDNVALVWRRTHATMSSGPFRSQGGELLAPVRPEIGGRVVLIGPPFAPGLGPRVVIPTMIVAIEEWVG